jgi:uncharacterized protein (TIGR00255 family)
MISMTGYGYTEYQDERLSLTIELKSYNNRYLDIYLNLPGFLSPLEPALRTHLAGQISRGKVECTVRVKELEENVEIMVDRKAAQGYAQALREVIDSTGLSDEVTLDHLLRFEGVLKTQKSRDLEGYEDLIRKHLEPVLSQFQLSRLKEGAVTAEDIRENLAVLQEGADYFASRASDLEEELQSSLRQRFEQLLGDKGDDGRIMQEIAVLLVKYSISEEIVRLGGHLKAFRDGMEEPGPQGKRLDFLCQEMNREVNTIGSKSTMGDVIQKVVACKDAVEKIREQLRNLE